MVGGGQKAVGDLRPWVFSVICGSILLHTLTTRGTLTTSCPGAGGILLLRWRWWWWETAGDGDANSSLSHVVSTISPTLEDGLYCGDRTPRERIKNLQAKANVQRRGTICWWVVWGARSKNVFVEIRDYPLLNATVIVTAMVCMAWWESVDLWDLPHGC